MQLYFETNKNVLTIFYWKTFFFSFARMEINYFSDLFYEIN